MRLIIFFLLIFSFPTVYAEKDETPSVNVNCNMTKEDSSCKIAIKEPFALNNEAPFKFKLQNDKGDTVENITKSQFAGDGKHSFEYKTKTVAKHYSYWFVACKYEDGKVKACKTFKGEK